MMRMKGPLVLPNPNVGFRDSSQSVLHISIFPGKTRMSDLQRIFSPFSASVRVRGLLDVMFVCEVGFRLLGLTLGTLW